MTASYRIAISARRDLQEISDYRTVEAGEDIASRVLMGVIETLFTVSHHPQAGVAADQYGKGARKFPAWEVHDLLAPVFEGYGDTAHISRSAPSSQSMAQKPEVTRHRQL